MAVNIFTFPISEKPDVHATAIAVIQFLNQVIDSAYVSNKTISYEYTDIPDWAIEVSNQPVDEYHTVKAVLNFSYHGTDFCLVGYVFEREGYQHETRLRIYARNLRGSATELIYRAAKGDSSATTWKFLIAQNNDYFVFSSTLTSTGYYRYCVFRIDAPVNPDDKDAFISVIPGRLSYNKAFAGEDLSSKVYLVTDASKTKDYLGGLYSSSFVKNLYNNKIPVYNVYAFHRTYGVRGRIKSLLVLPNSYTTRPNTFYSLNGDIYVGLYSLNEELDDYSGVLLRVY